MPRDRLTGARARGALPPETTDEDEDFGLPVCKRTIRRTEHSELAPMSTRAATSTKVQSCAVAWCAAVATVGAHCPIHAKDATIHPQTLAADEEATDILPCAKCKESGKCPTCKGLGIHDHYCPDCSGYMSHECRVCDGSAKCQACAGEGQITHRKKAEADA